MTSLYVCLNFLDTQISTFGFVLKLERDEKNPSSTLGLNNERSHVARATVIRVQANNLCLLYS